MTLYRINEIFYSIQGEGLNSGMPAVFVRFSGCNLCCPFCDTEHSAYKEYNSLQIINEIQKYPSTLIVLTGGEPGLSIDNDLVRQLRSLRRTIAIETNGTIELPEGIDFVTLSPKCDFSKGGEVKLQKCDELKLVYDGKIDPERYKDIQATFRFLQPCDIGDRAKNREIIRKTYQYCLSHPQWRISLQIHKILNVP